MVITNQLIFIFLALLFVAGVLILIIKMMRDPKNKGKEFGQIVLEMVLLYPKSIFLGMLLWFGIAEAFLAASSDHSDVSPIARMMTHSGMAILAFFAGTVWIKEMTELGEALKSRNAWDIVISLGLVLITSGLTIGTPVANLIVIANNLGETDALVLFWHRVQVACGLRSIRVYMAELYSMGKPLDYNALSGLSGAMLASVFVTVVTLALIVWEALKIARSNRESTKATLRNDLGSDPKDDKKDAKKDDKKDAKKDDQAKDAPTKELLELLFKFVGLTGEDIKSKKNVAYEILSSKPEEVQLKIMGALGELAQEVAGFSGSTSEKQALVDKIVGQIKKGPGKGGLGMTLNPSKAK